MMNENLDLFKKVITHPSQTVDKIQEKSWKLFVILLIGNCLLMGITYGICHFIVDIFVGVFWLLVVGFGLLLLIYLGSFLGIYFGVAKILKEKEIGKSLKLLGFYMICAFTLYHFVAIILIIVFITSHNSYLAVSFYDLSHLVLLFWIVALSVQGIQLLKKESEIRTLIKVFSSIFGAYTITTIVYLVLGALLATLVVR